MSNPSIHFCQIQDMRSGFPRYIFNSLWSSPRHPRWERQGFPQSFLLPSILFETSFLFLNQICSSSWIKHSMINSHSRMVVSLSDASHNGPIIMKIIITITWPVSSECRNQCLHLRFGISTQFQFPH